MTTKPKRDRYSSLTNRAMAAKLTSGEAIDVSACKREGTYYILPQFKEGKDYCDAAKEDWIWCIAKRHSDGVILASTTTDHYGSKLFECLWLR